MKENLQMFFITVLLILMAILVLPFFILYTPIDYVIYLFSDYRRDMKKRYGKKSRYTWMTSLDPIFKLCEQISKNHLDVQFYRNVDVKRFIMGYFCHKDVLFIIDSIPHYVENVDEWFVYEEEDSVKLKNYIGVIMDNFNKFMRENNSDLICKRVVFLVNQKEIDINEKEYLESANFVLLYDNKNFSERMKKLLINL